MTPAECAAALKKPIGDLGAAFMFDPATRERGKERGLRGRPLYHLGRGGALGDVPAEVVVAAFAFWPPAIVTEHWTAGREVMAPYDAALLYAECCQEWGRRHLTGELDRPLALLERVVDAAEPAALPLFAAWRRLPRPADAPGRLAQVVNVMREHRGSVHAAACAALGLHPLAAVMAGAYGESNARFFEWPEPYPDPAEHRARWDAAEDLTAAGAAPPYDVLSSEERVELVADMTRLHAAATS
jgi:hypothetical protein